MILMMYLILNEVELEVAELVDVVGRECFEIALIPVLEF